jgi:hypothetical protein
MITAIINRLKTGSIKRVVLFGDSDRIPEPPYVVVKSEKGPIQNRYIRLIIHRNQGEQDLLENYVFNELTDLLGKHVWLTTQNGGRFRLLNGEIWSEPILGNDDGTIAMERIFILPYRLS